jgi:hypothetical protein
MKNILLILSTLTMLIFSSYSVNADDSEVNPKMSLTIGASYLSNEGFSDLKGTGRTVNDEDDVTHFTVGYNMSPRWSLEAGMLSSSQITSRLYSGASGTLHGKSYSVSQGCGGCAAGGSGTLNLKAEIDDSYMFGVKFNTNSKRSLDLYSTFGVLYWSVDYTANDAQLTYDGTAKSGRFLEVDGNNAYMGLGATYKINKNSSIAFEYLVSKIHDSRIRGSSLAFKQSF